MESGQGGKSGLNGPNGLNGKATPILLSSGWRARAIASLEWLLLKVLSQSQFETLLLWAFGVRIPMLLFATPTVVELNEQRCEIRIPLNWRTRNHLGSMYFGTLAVGADCAGGLMAMRLIQKHRVPVSLIFKDFQADFIKRAEGDVHFSLEAQHSGSSIPALVQRAIDTGERQNLKVEVVATVPKKTGSQPVARFQLTLSLKRRSGELSS
ncbi:MAG: DUF4442 domain-containing protein [Bdellovibrionia bacterium]